MAETMTKVTYSLSSEWKRC